MELNICGKQIEILKIKGSQFTDLLAEEKPLLIFGKSGVGKSARVQEYAEKTGKKLITISLAMEMPETTGGIPYATKEGYFKRLLDERLLPILENEGENTIIFFDEINQAPEEVMNCIYQICHPDPKQRNWNGHSLANAQIVGAGNLDNGEDNTVYLTPLPTPLTNRFFVAELISDNTETRKYLKDKWKNKIPQVASYIDEMLKCSIPPRDIDLCLDILAYDRNALLMQMKLGETLTRIIYNKKNSIKTADPADVLRRCRQSYEIFKEDGAVAWAAETISTEEDLLEKFSEILTDEEIQSIVKGVE